MNRRKELLYALCCQLPVHDKGSVIEELSVPSLLVMELVWFEPCMINF